MTGLVIIVVALTAVWWSLRNTTLNRRLSTESADPKTNAAMILYWRPGCVACMSLRANLRLRGITADERNIWDDPDHAAVVRSHADGNETVPTVVVGEVGLVNPSIKEVRAALEAA